MAVKPERQRIRYSVRAWTAIISVAVGPVCLAVVALVPIPPGNRDVVIMIATLLIGWGGKVIDNQFRTRADPGQERT